MPPPPLRDLLHSVIICSRAARIRQRPRRSASAASAVPGWIIGDVMIDVEGRGIHQEVAEQGTAFLPLVS